MYTIKQAASRTGVSIPTIRVWERRYGVVEPTRTAAGYRLYDDDSIARLTAMRNLIDREGWRPRQAAERVRATDGAELAVLAGTPETPPPATPTGVAIDAIDGLIDGARRLDVASLDRTLDETFAGQRFESAMDGIVFPALRGIGDAWERGELDVAREHAASETIRRRIAHYFDAAGRGDGTAPIVVGLPPGSRHELGALAFAVAARRAGFDVLYLGADVPLEAWRRTIRDSEPAVAVLGVISPSDVRSATKVIRALRDDGVRAIAIGGPSAADIPAGIGASRLPEATDAAVAALAEIAGTLGDKPR
jgi:DNA-binding transcriptional MerR regulator/methanogenic corrinoid protein MtbC1